RSRGSTATSRRTPRRSERCRSSARARTGTAASQRCARSGSSGSSPPTTRSSASMRFSATSSRSNEGMAQGVDTSGTGSGGSGAGSAASGSGGNEAGEGALSDLDGSGLADPRFFTRVGDDVFFVKFAEGYASSLWVTDGTSAGTRQVADVRVDGHGYL